jgi:hypothetical protein
MLDDSFHPYSHQNWKSFDLDYHHSSYLTTAIRFAKETVAAMFDCLYGWWNLFLRHQKSSRWAGPVAWQNLRDFDAADLVELIILRATKFKICQGLLLPGSQKNFLPEFHFYSAGKCLHMSRFPRFVHLRSSSFNGLLHVEAKPLPCWFVTKSC